jgi:uncharacterized protein (TIGR00296 family)
VSDFRFELTDEEKNYLRSLVAASIDSGLHPGQGAARQDEPPTDKLREHLGAFVTLKVWNMARSAAFQDPRFPPLTEGEFGAVEYEISVLGPITPCPDPTLVEVGRHGLIMRRGGRSGLLLPQVPVEWNWDRETFLAQTCVKAGLPRNAWKEPDTDILWFEAVVF